MGGRYDSDSWLSMGVGNAGVPAGNGEGRTFLSVHLILESSVVIPAQAGRWAVIPAKAGI